MNQNQRRARAIAMRKGQPLPRTRTAPVPDTVLADLDAIDAATDNPTIHAATARIRTALDEPAPTAANNPAAAVEVRDPCPRCEDCPLIPRHAMADHMRDTHPEEQQS